MGEKGILIENVKKAYHHNTVLDIDQAYLALGNIYGIIGTNGVGKTTLLKIISEKILPDSGFIKHDLSIEMVCHENGLFQDMTVYENMFLNREPKLSFFGLKKYDWKQVRLKTKEILNAFNLDIDPKARVSELKRATQKLLEVVIALSKEPDVLIIDEPLTLLDLEQVQFLNDMVKNFMSSERMTIYSSHRLDELFQVVNQVITMRNGKIVGIVEAEEAISGGLLEFSEKDIHKYPKRRIRFGEPILTVQGLKTEHILNIDFELRKGEILGIIGLRGANKSTIGKALFGALPYDGHIKVEGSEKRIRTTTHAVEAGLCYLESSNEGMFVEDSVMENIVSANVPRVRRLSKSAERLVSKYYLELLNISNTQVDYLMEDMSAGNKQKILLAKWFFSKSKIFIFNKPTANVDNSSKVDIYNIFADLAASGAGIILISNDLEEVAGLCDRVLVIEGGKIKQEINRKDLSVHNLIKILQDW
ncbi:MAG: hypothetical protein CVU95_03525 [Firmicutes bacterium HGW-Firmicutes-2]|jgi:ribose transport system ATP-binding protein|nr:MAG: hypothetical protein CVU95_03525 [Firmicutes bacterium HGW-Firmicutes-2]